MTDRKNGEFADTRNPDGTFANGNSGRPRGTRNKATQAVLGLLENATGQLTQTAINRALEGDTAALRLCLERICPVRKDIPVEFDLPPMRTASDAAKAAAAILDAVSSGAITPIESTSIMSLVDSYRRTLEATDFVQRLEALEIANAK